MNRITRRFFGLALAATTLPVCVLAQDGGGSFDQRLRRIMARPEFKHSRFGVAIYSLSDNRLIYELNAQQFFVPASVTKLFTAGTSLALLGPEYRFHTRIYRAGPLNTDGTVAGDLVLVASGDPNLSQRVEPGGTLAFTDVDHSYMGMPGAKPVPGDPLAVIRELARKVAASGVRTVDGQVQIDDSLFPEGARDLGTFVAISPVSINDNLIDVWLEAGDAEGDPVKVRLSPETAYVRVLNQVKTGPAGSARAVRVISERTTDEGEHAVTVAGSIPAKETQFLAYRVPEPSVFANIVLRQALQEAGVRVTGRVSDSTRGPFDSTQLVAEHVSPPLAEAVKVILKVSQNLHASMMPYIWGAAGGHPGTEALRAGFDREREFLVSAGLDMTAYVQSDGAGGDAYFTPEGVVRYLAYISRQPYFEAFRKGLPLLGVDGTLHDIQVNSPAAGKVSAKTGTLTADNLLQRAILVRAKGLAGYVTTADGRRLAIALFLNHVPGDPTRAVHDCGETLGEIATAVYEAAPAP